MLPVSSVITSPVPQIAVVTTTTPVEVAATRVPYDNVPPSFSSTQVNNNTKGNNAGLAASPQQAENLMPLPTSTATFTGTLGATSSGNGLGASAMFIAQLASQDNSPETQNMLIQYEKLLVFSNVKYKPSLAFKPEPESSSVFNRPLQPQAEVKAPPQPNAAPQATLPDLQNVAVAAPAAAPPPVRSAKPAGNAEKVNTESEAEEPQESTAGNQPAEPTVTAPTISVSNTSSRALNAYAASISRITSQAATSPLGEVA